MQALTPAQNWREKEATMTQQQNAQEIEFTSPVDGEQMVGVLDHVNDAGTRFVRVAGKRALWALPATID